MHQAINLWIGSADHFVVRRVSGGRVQAWKSALDTLRSHRWDLLQMGAFLTGCLIVFNLPYFPAYQRGLDSDHDGYGCE